jgi:hypothetical protein
LEDNSKKYIYYQETLGIETSRFEDLEDLRNDLNMRMAVWNSLDEWQKLTAQWVITSFANTDAQTIQNRCDHYAKVNN